MDYLSKSGKAIYKRIEAHCKELGILKDIDTYELSMLANSIDLYGQAAKFCRDNGISQQSKNGWQQVNPEYSVMRQEYQSIVKHSAKFGINPYDRERILNLIKNPKTVDIDELDFDKHL